MPTTEETLLQAWQSHQRGDIAGAQQVYAAVLQREPNNANAWCYLGISFHDQKRYVESVTSYERAIQLQPHFPIALNNMGNSLRYLGRVTDADAAFQKAIDQQPKYFNAYRNRGTLHAWTGRIDLAFKYYYEAMQIQPDDAELHRNLGVIHLLQGNFEDGWREYRHRWRCNDATKYTYSQRKWTGQDLAGKTILLYAEQGLGDSIQFVRFAKVLKDRGARTILHVQPSLLALLQHAPAIDALIPNNWAVDQSFHFHCSLIDAADMLKVDLNSIPAEVPYLRLTENLIGYWKSQLNRLLPPAKTRIGLVWQGNPDHQADMFRSFPLQAFGPLAELNDVQLISLQFGKGAEQLKTWSGSKPIYTLPADIDKSSGAFMDTAAILHHLDYIVTSDTSMAHLAGALGRKTMIVLGYTPDWRWLLGRKDSLWYPTAQLFRQKVIGQWNDVVQEVVDAIGSELALQESSTQATSIESMEP